MGTSDFWRVGQKHGDNIQWGPSCGAGSLFVGLTLSPDRLDQN